MKARTEAFAWRTLALLIVAPLALASTALAEADAIEIDALLGGALEWGPRDRDGDGTADELVATVRVNASAAATYVVTLQLRESGGERTREFFSRAALERGDSEVVLSIPGPFIRNEVGPGKVSAEVRVASANGTVLDARNHVLGDLTHVDWAEGGARLSAPPRLYVAATGGDGAVDALRLDAVVNVTRVGVYELVVCPQEEATRPPLACEQRAVFELAEGGAAVTMELDPATWSGRRSPVRAEIRDGATGEPLDSAQVDAPPLRASVLEDSRVRATFGSPRVSGTPPVLRFPYLVEPRERGAFELSLDVVEPSTGWSVSTSSGLLHVNGPGNDSVRLTGDVAERIARAPSSALAYWRVLDSMGTLVAGGRIEIPRSPELSLVVEPQPHPRVGHPTHLRVLVLDGPTPTEPSWRVDGSPPATGDNHTVVFDRPGWHQVTYSALNAVGATVTATQSFSVLQNAAPHVQPPRSWFVSAGEEARLALTAEDPEGEALAWSLTDAPTGVRLHGPVLVWRPTVEQAGDAVIGVAVSDGWNVRVLNVTARVQAPVDLREPTGLLRGPTTSGAPRIFVRELGSMPREVQVPNSGEPFRLRLGAESASGGPLEVEAVDLPTGGRFDGGVFEWDEPAAGTHALVLRAADGGYAAVATVHLVVDELPEPAAREAASLSLNSFVGLRAGTAASSAALGIVAALAVWGLHAVGASALGRR